LIVMAEEHSGEGEFKGGGDFVARLTDVAAALDRLEGGQASIGTKLSALETGLSSVEAGQTKLRADVMERIDRLEDGITGMRDDLTVTFGASDSVRRAHSSTREELRELSDSVSALYRKLARLETQVRELKGDP
jgi:phage shock protein A